MSPCLELADRQTLRPDHLEGTIGRNFSFQTVSGADLWFEDDKSIRSIGTGGLGSQIDEYNGDNFDHFRSRLHRGRGILTLIGAMRADRQANNLPPGTPRWGSDFKKAYSKYYQNYGVLFNQGTSMPTSAAISTSTRRTRTVRCTTSASDVRLMPETTVPWRNSPWIALSRSASRWRVACRAVQLRSKPFTTAIVASNHTIGGA